MTIHIYLGTQVTNQLWNFEGLILSFCSHAVGVLALAIEPSVSIFIGVKASGNVFVWFIDVQDKRTIFTNNLLC